MLGRHVGKEAFLIAPNYQAGKDMMEAFKETFVPATDYRYPFLEPED